MFFNAILDALFHENLLIPSKGLKQARAALNGTDFIALICPDNRLSRQIPQDELWTDNYLLSHVANLSQVRFTSRRSFLAPTLDRGSYIEFKEHSVCLKVTPANKTLEEGKPVKVIHTYCWNPGVPFVGSDRIFMVFVLDGLFVPLRAQRTTLLTRLRVLSEPGSGSQAHSFVAASSEQVDFSTIIGKDKVKLKKANAAIGILLMALEEGTPVTLDDQVRRYQELISQCHESLVEIGVDNRRLLHEVVECHMSSRGLGRLKQSFKNSKYSQNVAKLAKLDVSQVELPEGMNLAKCERLINRVVELFDDVVMCTTINDLCVVLVRVIDSLGQADLGVPVSADALIGLFLLVVSRAERASRLDAYLCIVRRFSYNPAAMDRGRLGYTLMLVESVVQHVQDDSEQLIAQAATARTFWRTIESGMLEAVKALPNKSIFKARRGGTALFTCIQNNFCEIAHYILDSGVLSVQDIIEDRNERGSTLMISCLKWDSPLVDRLVQIISELPEATQREYYQLHDNSRRSVGHYLFHRADLIQPLGPLVHWTLRDQRSMSPLSTLAVCYDHPDYDEMLVQALDAIMKQDPPGSLYQHQDSKGNSFLHLVNPHTPELMEKIAAMPGFDITLSDMKFRSVLSIALRFNRLDFAKFLLKTMAQSSHRALFLQATIFTDHGSKQLVQLIRSSEELSSFSVPELISVTAGHSVRFELLEGGVDGAKIFRSVGDFLHLRSILQIQYPVSWQPALGKIDERWVSNTEMGRAYLHTVTEIMLAYFRSLKGHATIKSAPEFIDFCTDPDWNGEETLIAAETSMERRLEPVDKQQNFDGSEKHHFCEQEAQSINTFFKFSTEQMQALMQQLVRFASSTQHLMNAFLEDTIVLGETYDEISNVAAGLLEPARPIFASMVRLQFQHAYGKVRVICSSLALDSAQIVKSLTIPVRMISEMEEAQRQLTVERLRLVELGSRKVWPLAFFEDRRLTEMHEIEDRISALRSTIGRLMSRVSNSQDVLASELSAFMAFHEKTLMDAMEVICLSQINYMKAWLGKTEFTRDYLRNTPAGAIF